MDRNDSNPGMIERQLDDAPMHAGSREDGVQGDRGMERDSMRGEGMERDSMEGREHRGGYGDDTPTGTTTQRDW